jgi:hypothetical protein
VAVRGRPSRDVRERRRQSRPGRHERRRGTTRRSSVDPNGNPSNGKSDAASISADGRFVCFHSIASNLVANDTNGTDDVFLHGPDLTLEADPQMPVAGATLTFSTWTGGSSAPSLLVVTDVNGTPSFFPALLGAFDVNGLWTFAATVPSGLAGDVITFETLGIVPSGKVGVSNPFAVSFQ